MESRSDQGKRGHYDLSMSRRTRKPAAVAAVKASPDWGSEWGKDGYGARRPSLKDLLKEGSGGEGVGLTANAAEGKAEADQVAASTEEEKVRPPANGGNLPRQEEKHLQMVRVGGPGAEGVKLAGMVTRCVKVLNHLVKTRSGSKKKTTVQFLK